jgi:DMSO reductase anchor subunit
MSPLMDMGKAGLGLASFLFVMSAGLLWLARPEVGTAPFVMTVLVLVVALVLGTVLMLAMRRTVRSQHLAVHHKEQGDSRD